MTTLTTIFEIRCWNVVKSPEVVENMSYKKKAKGLGLVQCKTHCLVNQDRESTYMFGYKMCRIFSEERGTTAAIQVNGIVTETIPSSRYC